MKILNVYFKNINSLEGENRLHFDKAPISDAGVFAITGVNGSGKSSILDAITLALYGETVRFNKPGNHVMTKGTLGCFSQVEFLVDGEQYRSSWQVKRVEGNDQALMPVEMQLVKLADETIILSKEAHQVLTHNIELTGMDFRRFTRSIVLAQGDFAAFLNALDAERMDILVRILNQDIYTDYKKNIDAAIEQEVQKLLTLKSSAAKFNLMSAEEVETAALDLADQKLTLSEFKQEKTSLLQLQASWDTLDALEKQREVLKEKQSSDELALSKIQQSLERMNAAKEVLVFKSVLIKLSEKQVATEQLTTVINEQQQENIVLNEQLVSSGIDESVFKTLADLLPEQRKNIADAAHTRLTNLNSKYQVLLNESQVFKIQLPEKKQTLVTIDKWLLEHKREHFLVDNMPELGRLKNNRVLIIDLNKRLKGFNKQYKTQSSASLKNQGRVAAFNKEIDSSVKGLKKLSLELEFIADGHSVEEVQDLVLEQKERTAEFTELLNLAKVYKRFKHKNFTKRFAHVDEDLLDKQLKVKQDEVFSVENIQTILEKAVYREALTHRLDSERNNLEYDTACSLCGSKLHPYTQHMPVVHDSKKALSDQRGIVKKAHTEEKNILREIADYTKFKERNIEHLERINRVKTEWITLCSRLNAAHEGFDITGFRAMRHAIKREKNELKEMLALAKRYRLKNKEIAKTETRLIKQREKLLKIENKQIILDESAGERPANISGLELELEEAVTIEIELARRITEQLAVLALELPAAGKEDKIYDFLNQCRQDYQMYSLRQRSVSDEIAELTHKLTEHKGVVAEFDVQLAGSKRELAECTAFELYEARLAIESKLVDYQQQLETEKGEIVTLEKTLTNMLNNSAYSVVQDVEKDLLLWADKEYHETTLVRLNKQLQDSAEALIAVMKQYDAEELHLQGQEPADIINKQLRDKGIQLEIAEQEISGLQKKMSSQKYLRLSNTNLLKEIDEQMISVKRAEVAQEQMNNESELTIKEKARAQVVDKLMSTTNDFLHKINARYQIKGVLNDDGFTIDIIDDKQAQKRRSVKTLSGGEAFIVSLSLALGLSEMANNGKAVDSLFIDEGFGNLDAETLYSVITTLESLKTQGKVVGIISHVEGIKERIKTQIELVKQPNGISRIVI